MSFNEPSFTLGVEEEYLLVDKSSRDLATDPPKQLLADCQEMLSRVGRAQVSPEFMRSQIEVGTARLQLDEGGQSRSRPPACDHRDLREPIRLRAHRRLDASLRGMGCPAAYRQGALQPLAADLQMIARRMLISGMHVHVGIEDEDLRIDIMNQAPISCRICWRCRPPRRSGAGGMTGLKSYRMSIFDELPRTGLPETSRATPNISERSRC